MVLQHHHLWQIGNLSIIGDSHRARCGRLKSTERFKEGGFASTILTDKCDTVTIVDHKGGIGKKGFSTKLY